ncbi:hypothetical protein B0H99_1119 [Planomicrobium soli]|uniref:Uncharacterized protein n=1 Tax=Planomicrobium soli TaxID=1176648 RepID=A0A2P8GCF4_9BACL|nr:hypothetical protein [Planomicrobium soli]PSL31627.1 hypothetical protein B0H99_1119 [Planomicrobium soli]
MNGDLQFYAVKTEWSPRDEAMVLKMDYELRAELAKTITCVGLLVDLSMDQHAVVRKGVAQNPYTPITTLRRLAEQDLCINVQDVAKNTLLALTS